MAIIDDGSGTVELTGEHLKDYIEKRFPNSEYAKKMSWDNELMITSKVDELTNEIIELQKTIRLLKQKLEYHKLG